MLNVLIADDEEIIRQGLARLVGQSGLGLTVAALAEDGEEALAAVERLRPEIILMDLNMPLLGGLEAIGQIRRPDRECAVIIISGYDQFSFAQRAMEMGVFAYLLKPVNRRELLETLERAVQARSRRAWELEKLEEQSPEPLPSQDIGLAAVGYLREHFADNRLSLSTAAKALHVSQSYLARVLKRKTGATFTDYLNNLRLAQAETLLADKDNVRTIAEIAELTGYSSQHYFSRAFKSHSGLSPNKYRAEKIGQAQQ